MSDNQTDCRAIFAKWTDDRDGFCEQLTKDSPNCECENQPVSLFSPGKIADGEVLCRSIYSPIHVDKETGCIVEAAFSDVKDKGLSVDRLSYIAAKDLSKKGEKKAEDDRAKGKNREYLGVVKANSVDIRKILSADKKRSFCVYDTAKANDRSHADVCQVLSGGKLQQKQARRELQKAFTIHPEILASPEESSSSDCAEEISSDEITIKKGLLGLSIRYLCGIPFLRALFK
jgi:hypothetical protein